MKRTCAICPHHCALEEGQTGLCRARVNRGGSVVCENYARVTSLALDPIEKKPLKRFHPGSMILSAGSYGCNLKCPFCQNYEISTAGADEAAYETIPPEDLIGRAESLRRAGNIGVAFTYNEPLVGYEYVSDCARLAKEKGLAVVLVTNGMICREPWEALLPAVDAANIDLKGFSEACYRAVGGDFETVKAAIALAAKQIHVEVTTLVVPGLNDDEEMMRREAAWLAGISEEICLHVTRFFPRYRMRDCAATPVKTVVRLAEIARERLKNVYTGNC